LDEIPRATILFHSANKSRRRPTSAARRLHAITFDYTFESKGESIGRIRRR
jgi:hypothetical protein